MLHLAKHNAHVYLCARSISKGNMAIENIKKEYPQAQVSLLQIDHLSLESVVAAAKLVISKETQLHGLVNNAGIMATPFEISKDGFEAQWQTNYLAHWLFTTHLLPLMLDTSKKNPRGTVRIVNLTSSGHIFAPRGGINFDDTSLPKSSPGARYGQSKLANILHAKMLNQKYGPLSESTKGGMGEIWTVSIHPGLVERYIAYLYLPHKKKRQLISGSSQLSSRSEGWVYRPLLSAFKVLGAYIDADRGSYTSVYCVASQELRPEDSGIYFERIAKRNGSTSAKAKDMRLAGKLYEYTEDIMGSKDFM